jgi:hypothetical protein
MLRRFGHLLDILAVLILLLIVGSSDSPRLTGQADRVRFFTREIEFDYPNWIQNATWTKLEQAAIHAPFTISRGTNKQIVYEYLRTTQNIIQTENAIETIYADPEVTDKEEATLLLRNQLAKLIDRQNEVAPFAEVVLQNQISDTLTHLGLTTAGQPLPPVLYHTSRTPLALIVSPRDKIVQTANISVLPTLTIDQQIALEDKIDQSLDVSSLVVPIGGVGVYPTMVMETTDLSWMLNTIAHEWTHNYLSLRPLGINYSTTPELRTMNETTASIAGDEIGYWVISRYYPELLDSTPVPASLQPKSPSSPPSDLPSSESPSPPPSNDPPAFDYRAEMHETRTTADQLLADGKTEEAETYMEQRRQVFWKNGYLLRKLNQAFFAFHGAYADVPGGAAGEDPVGPAVRELRSQSDSLADFIDSIAWMTSFDKLQEAVKQ